MAAGPADLDPVSSKSLPESEMHAQIILRKVTPAAPHFFHLAMTSRHERHSGPDAVTVRLHSDCSNRKRIVLSATSVEEQGGRIILIVHHDVHIAVIVEVAEGHAATGPHQTQSGPGDARKIFERPVPFISVKQAGGGIAGDINVRQTAVSEIPCEHAKSVVLSRDLDARLPRNVGKRPIVVVAVKMVRLAAQAPRTTKDRNAFPETKRVCAGLGSSSHVEIHVVGHEKIEPSIAVVIDEGASCGPIPLARLKPRSAGHILERPFARIAVKDIRPVVSHEEIFKAVVVIIAGANPLTPAGAGQSGALRDIDKFQVSLIAVEMICGRRSGRQAAEPGTIHDEYVH